jgi:hypothetical protein
MAEQRFEATIVKLKGKVVLPIPFDPNEVWGQKQRHHITGSINGHKVRGAIDWDETQPFLSLGPAWRRGAGVDVGDRVGVTLAPEGPQFADLAPDIAAALEDAPEARAFFEALATFYRKGYLKWIEGARRPETRAARIQEMVGLLRAGRKQRQ